MNRRRAPRFRTTVLALTAWAMAATAVAGPVGAVDPDVTPPDGTFQVFSADLDSYSGSTPVPELVARVTGASDSESGLDKLRISNTGTEVAGMLTTFQEIAIATTDWRDLVDWSVANGTGGSTTDGLHTVYAQWSDVAGNWTPIVSVGIDLDTKAPKVNAVNIGFAQSAPQSGIPIRISWVTSEVGAYEMQRQVDGGGWSPMSYDISSKQLVLGHSSKHSYRYRIRMRDWAGNDSDWTYSTRFKPAHYLETKKAVKYHGAWQHVIYVGSPFVTARSGVGGAYATFTFKGKGIAWESIRGPKRGRVTVSIDGKVVKTVDLKAKSYKWAVAYSRTWAKVGTHTIKIKVVGTKGRPNIDIDGFGVLR